MSGLLPGLVPVLAALMIQTAAPTTAQIRTIGYDAFRRLPESRQKAAFRDADPGTKAMLKRVHAQRWLEAHRRELGDWQVAAVERGIAFLTPELYQASPQDTLKQEVEMTNALECALGRRRVLAAFTFFPPEKDTFGSRVEEWLYRLHACVIG